jgi:opacity protein-like surface antigen
MGELTERFGRRSSKCAAGICGLAGLLLTSALVDPSSACGDDRSAPPPTLPLAGSAPSAPCSIWKDGVGNGFREGTFDAGLALGAGFGTRILGSSQSHDLALAAGSFGWMFTDVVAEDEWWSGNWEWLNEIFGGAQFNPDVDYLVGGTTSLRYSFATGTRWVPFVGGGVGLSATGIHHPDLGGTFEFNTQLGLGTHYFVRDDTAATLQYRWLHFSDANITSVNRGVNTQMFEVGLTWFF